jgi:hypothetical protein
MILQVVTVASFDIINNFEMAGMLIKRVNQTRFKQHAFVAIVRNNQPTHLPSWNLQNHKNPNSGENP